MSWVKDLGKATHAYWWASMRSAVYTTLGLYAIAFQKDNHRLIRSSFMFAGVFIVIAIALAWWDEHQRLLIELAKNDKPKFAVDVS